MFGNSSSLRLEMLNRYHLDDQKVKNFLEYLKTRAPVYAPHRKGGNSFTFQQVNNVENVVLDYTRTIQSIKKYFQPPKETLLNFNMETNEYQKPEIKEEKRIFFGVHSYDMQSVRRLDYSFYKGNPESNYIIRRQQAIFLGINYTPDEYHFSKSVGIEIEELDGFSLYLYKIEDGFIIFEVDEKGKELIEGFGQATLINNLPFEKKEKNFKNKIKYHYNRVPQVFDHVYNSKVWDKIAEKCVGCGTCNLLCPTCYCFDVSDEIELDAKTGSRDRVWDGCMLHGFAEVAGGENFREKLELRNRHRLYRKFKYITNQSGLIHCIGCGRCSAYCPAGISLTGIVNDLIEDYEAQQEKSNI